MEFRQSLFVVAQYMTILNINALHHMYNYKFQINLHVLYKADLLFTYKCFNCYNEYDLFSVYRYSGNLSVAGGISTADSITAGKLFISLIS